MLGLLNNTNKVYTKQLGMLVFFSIPFLFSLLVPLFSPAPTYAALGGSFLRSGSLPEMKPMDWAVVAVAVIVSLFLLSLALVAINLVVKAARTSTKVGTEALRNLGKYTFVVFCLFLAIKVVEMVVLYAALQFGANEFVVFLFGFVASLGLFYAAPAVVLEEKKPVPAFVASYAHIVRKPLHFIGWLVLAFIVLAIITEATYAVIDTAMTRQIVVALISSLIVLPYLLILQAQTYLMKYTIIQ
jgi:hypothetical protein